ncbi:MAG: hypothetical protein ACE365_05590 [Gammaproteobacteria bacterium]
MFVKTKLSQLLGVFFVAGACFVVAQPGFAECNACVYLQDIDTNTDNSATYLKAIDTNTDQSAIYLGEIYDMLSDLTSDSPSDLSNTMASYTIYTGMLENSYSQGLEELSKLEAYFQGQDDGSTLSANYKSLFPKALGGEQSDDYFPNALSAKVLFLSPSTTSYYDDDQDKEAQYYIAYLSGSASSQLKKPDDSWENTDSDDSEVATAIREYNSFYYNVVAAQSLVAYNFSQLYALNKGQDLDTENSDGLNNYSKSKISISGLLQYFVNEKASNEQWYEDLGSMTVTAVVKEIAMLVAGCLLELHRIEGLERQCLAAQTSLLSQALGSAAQQGSSLADSITDAQSNASADETDTSSSSSTDTSSSSSDTDEDTDEEPQEESL